MTDIERKPTTKVKRAISLSAKLDADLVELCGFLGLSTHAYLVAEAAKAIQRDRMVFLAKNSIEDMMKDFKRIADAK
jgi:hypothetical protein